MILRGVSLGLPSTRVAAWQSPEAALTAWLARAGLRVLRSGPLGYKHAPVTAGGLVSAVAFRVVVVECGEPAGVMPFNRVLVRPCDVVTAARRGGVGRSRMAVALDAADRFWREIDQEARDKRGVPVLGGLRSSGGGE